MSSKRDYVAVAAALRAAHEAHPHPEALAALDQATCAIGAWYLSDNPNFDWVQFNAAAQPPQ